MMRSAHTVAAPRHALFAVLAIWLSFFSSNYNNNNSNFVGAVVTKELLQLSQCSASAPVMDITSNSCLSCSAASGLVPDTSTTDIYGNPLSCKCNVGYVQIDNACVSTIICIYYIIEDIIAYISLLLLLVVIIISGHLGHLHGLHLLSVRPYREHQSIGQQRVYVL